MVPLDMASRGFAMGLQGLRRSPRLLVTAAALVIGELGSGCLSNEYVIPADELARMVELPPQTRGDRVRIVQKIGERRTFATEPGAWPPLDGPPPGDGSVGVWYEGPIILPGPPVAGRAPPPAPPVAGTRPLPARPRDAGGKSSWRGGGGGGGGGKNDLIVVALVVLALATVSVVALSFTEGSRYDGVAQIAPGQPVHLENELGQERVLPLGALSRGDVIGTSAAVVMDDEGYGLRLTGRGPLDRRGGAFKLDVGTLASSVAGDPVTGLAANLQAGGFPLQRLGILAAVSAGGGSDSLGRTFTRYDLGLELQSFPVRLGRLHAGPFVHGGYQFISEADERDRSGPAVGGGLMLEVDLTTRLALYARAGVTGAHLGQDDWRTTAALTLGLAVY
jgi:hypothetical protein